MTVHREIAKPRRETGATSKIEEGSGFEVSENTNRRAWNPEPYALAMHDAILSPIMLIAPYEFRSSEAEANRQPSPPPP